MKTVANTVVTLAWAVAAIVAAICDAIREDAKKRRLGRHYEGPAAD